MTKTNESTQATAPKTAKPKAMKTRLRKSGTDVLHDRSVSPPVYRIVTAAVQ